MRFLLHVSLAAVLWGLALPVSAGPLNLGDPDMDGVITPQDNCSQVFQSGPTFCDSDQDGFGNLCDGDLNNDTVVNGLDFSRPGASNDFLDCFLVGSDPSAVGCDINCDTVVNGLDFSSPGADNDFLDFFSGGIPPGPSGLPCAGTVPCP